MEIKNAALRELVQSMDSWSAPEWNHDDWSYVVRRGRGEERERLDRMDIPRRLQRWLMGERGQIQSTRALARVHKWLGEDDKHILVLSGPRGTGKSLAAAWALSSCGDGSWRRATQLARAGLYDAEALRPFFYGHMLVLDDVAVEYDDKGGVMQTLLDEVIGARYDDERPTVITTNAPRAVFQKRVGARVLDRIREVGAFFSISGASMRGGTPCD